MLAPAPRPLDADRITARGRSHDAVLRGRGNWRARRARARQRGVTLIELLIAMAIVVVVAGGAVAGLGAARAAALRSSAVMITAAVRTAFAHSNAISRPVRLVFDFDKREIVLEESEGQFIVERGVRGGGAAAATELEMKAQEEANRILKGPRAPRASFSPTKAFGFDPDSGQAGKSLEGDARFLQVETRRDVEPEVEGRAYLYFWPGGQTERAAITLVLGTPSEQELEANTMTILVSPLTGKCEIKKGIVRLPPERVDGDSEREDYGP